MLKIRTRSTAIFVTRQREGFRDKTIMAGCQDMPRLQGTTLPNLVQDGSVIIGNYRKRVGKIGERSFTTNSFFVLR